MESTSMASARRFNEKDHRFVDKDIYYEQAPFSTNKIGKPEVGVAAEFLAKKMGITKANMDIWAFNSHIKAKNARDKNF